MGRQVKVLLIGAAFTVVAMGFAYAVPRAMHSAAGGSSQDSIRLLTGTEESPAPSTPSDGDCDEPVSSVDPSPSEPAASVDPGASEEPSESEDPVGSEEPAASEEPPASEEPVASEQPASEAPVGSEEPCDDGEDDEPDDPADEEEEDGEDGEGSSGATTNHGSAVRVAAHCDVHGRAHGELVRSVAQDKNATVASAEQACASALSAEGGSKDKAKDKSKDKAKPKDKKTHDRKDAGEGGHGGGPGSSKKAHVPSAPKAAPPVKVKASNAGGGSTNSAPGNSASKGKSKVKKK